MVRMVIGCVLIVLFLLQVVLLVHGLNSNWLPQGVLNSWRMMHGYALNAPIYQEDKPSILRTAVGIYSVFYLLPGLALTFFGYRSFKRKRFAVKPVGSDKPETRHAA